MRSIYDIEMNSAEETPNFLQQFKGKAVLLINTTVGCGNAGHCVATIVVPHPVSIILAQKSKLRIIFILYSFIN